MTKDSFSYSDFETTRTRLVHSVNAILTDTDRKFLLSFKAGSPDWGLYPIEGLENIWAVFCSKLRGHIHYYGVSFNFRAVQNFQMKATRILFKWLNRRSQRRSMNWEQFALYIRANPLPKVTICHALF